jgi:hypothetical protein
MQVFYVQKYWIQDYRYKHAHCANLLPTPLLIKRLNIRHHPQPLPLLLPARLASSAPRFHMLAQLLQNLTVPPPHRHGPVRRLERPHRLRPLARCRLPLPLVLLLHHVVPLSLAVDIAPLRSGRGQVAAAAFRGLGAGRRGRLRRPVVDVPVVFVEEEVVLLELG